MNKNTNTYKFTLFSILIILICLLGSSCSHKKLESLDNKEKNTNLSDVKSSTSIKNDENKKLSEDTKISTSTVAEKTETKKNVLSEEEQILEFIDPIYFNIIFGGNSYENGIGEKDMKLFAVSYIFQHKEENEKLKFDTEKFVLYVPAIRVEELVKQYFDVDISEHFSYEEEGIMFEKGFYLMPAVDMNWNEKIIIEDVTKPSENIYLIKIMFDSPDGALPKKELKIEKREGRFILLEYREVL